VIRLLSNVKGVEGKNIRKHQREREREDSQIPSIDPNSL
jgi:hypothetical protein